MFRAGRRSGPSIWVPRTETLRTTWQPVEAGDITLPDDTPVNDTGLQDDAIYGFLSYDFTDSQLLSFRFNRYRAGFAGFGWVDPILLGELDKVQITYPFQDFDRYNVVPGATPRRLDEFWQPG